MGEGGGIKAVNLFRRGCIQRQHGAVAEAGGLTVIGQCDIQHWHGLPVGTIAGLTVAHMQAGDVQHSQHRIIKVAGAVKVIGAEGQVVDHGIAFGNARSLCDCGGGCRKRIRLSFGLTAGVEVVLSQRLTKELVARLPCSIPDPGPMARPEVPDSYYTQTTQAVLQACPAGGLRVFAYGSILWKRRFEVVEERAARVRGWHRKFSLGPDTRYRGNPDAPGVMLSLDRGGQCQGKVLRMSPVGIDAALEHLLRNEPPIPPAWLRAVTPLGEVRAIAFVNRRDFVGYCGGLCETVVADRLASAVGMWGSMAEYLMNTVQHLEAMGIRDNYLSRLEEMVAERLGRESEK